MAPPLPRDPGGEGGIFEPQPAGIAGRGLRAARKLHEDLSPLFRVTRTRPRESKVTATFTFGTAAAVRAGGASLVAIIALRTMIFVRTYPVVHGVTLTKKMVVRRRKENHRHVAKVLPFPLPRDLVLS